MEAVSEGRYSDARKALSEAQAIYDSIGMEVMNKAIDELQKEIADAEEQEKNEKAYTDKGDDDTNRLLSFLPEVDRCVMCHIYCVYEFDGVYVCAFACVSVYMDMMRTTVCCLFWRRLTDV